MLYGSARSYLVRARLRVRVRAEVTCKRVTAQTFSLGRAIGGLAGGCDANPNHNPSLGKG